MNWKGSSYVTAEGKSISSSLQAIWMDPVMKRFSNLKFFVNKIHPVFLELFNPQSSLVNSQVSS